MNPQMQWWLENTAHGRRTQRRMLPESALGPRARADVRQEREDEERRMVYLFASSNELAHAAAMKMRLHHGQWRRVWRPRDMEGLTADRVVLVEPFTYDRVTSQAYAVLCRRPGKLRVVNLDERGAG